MTTYRLVRGEGRPHAPLLVAAAFVRVEFVEDESHLPDPAFVERRDANLKERKRRFTHVNRPGCSGGTKLLPLRSGHCHRTRGSNQTHHRRRTRRWPPSSRPDAQPDPDGTERPPRGIEHRNQQKGIQVRRPPKRLEELLTINPPLGQLPGVVEPSRDGVGRHPRNIGVDHAWVSILDHLHQPLTQPAEKADSELRTNQTSRPSPLQLQLIDPNNEAALVETLGRVRATEALPIKPMP